MEIEELEDHVIVDFKQFNSEQKVKIEALCDQTTEFLTLSSWVRRKY